MKIALAGNPNSGKTSMYNALTGCNEKVGNWAGVTVAKKEHLIKRKFRVGTEDIIITDLPGAYSITPFTSEEGITSDYVKKEKPDVIINIVDATNLSRSLFFTTQLLELGIPVVIALNKSDISKKKMTEINVALLSERLGCNIVETTATLELGLKAVIEKAVGAMHNTQTAQSKSGLDDRERFEFVNGLISEVLSNKTPSKSITVSDKIDKIITNKWLGIPIFAVVMFLVFQISQTWLGTWIAEGVELPNGVYINGLVPMLEMFQSFIGDLLENANPVLHALLVDGIIGGVIAVVGFLPLVMVLYFLIAILEDCGYMSRVAVLLDPIFKKVGLSGKSVIPFVITIGCAVPGIMASRTIRDKRECRATAMLAPFIPCGAKIPVISLFAGAFFDNSGWVSATMYLTGIVLIFIGALLVNAITGNKNKRSYFIIELPEYKAPSFVSAFKTMCSRGWSYIVKASTIILLCNTVVQIMQTFNRSFGVAETADSSILASVARPFAYLLVPIVGVVSWQLAAAAVTGFIAKENVVGTLAVCFVGLNNLIDTEELAILDGAGADVAGVIAISKVAALAYLMFNLYTPPCFAAIGAMNSEMKSAKWVFGGIGLQLGVGYTVGYIVYTAGTLITDPHSLAIVPAVCGLIAVIAFAAVIAKMILKNKTKLEA